MSESLATRLEATVRRLSSDIGERLFRAHALDEAPSFIREELAERAGRGRLAWRLY
jgi:hypothetical protein